MKSLRDLLHVLLSWLQLALAGWLQEPTNSARPGQGPAHPRVYVRKLHASAPRLLAPRGVPGVTVPLAHRPRRAPPPPHILALLANAPDVEPEFARLRARHVALLAPLRRLEARVRVYNPRLAPAAPAIAPRPTGASWAIRMTRAMGAFFEWLALTAPAPRGKRH